MLRKKELIDLIESGENFSCEFKLKFSSFEKIAKEMIAFANSKGGYIIIGVDDTRKIVGVSSEKEETALLLETSEKYCEPPVVINFGYFNFNKRELVVAYIPQSSNKPHRIQDYKNSIDINTAQVFIRVNDKSIPAGKEMIKVMSSLSSELTLHKYQIGELEKRVFKFLETNETISVEELKVLANISERRASRTLIKLVRAGLLFIHNKDNGGVFFSAALNL